LVWQDSGSVANRQDTFQCPNYTHYLQVAKNIMPMDNRHSLCSFQFAQFKCLCLQNTCGLHAWSSNACVYKTPVVYMPDLFAACRDYQSFRVSTDGELQGVGLLIANQMSEEGHLLVLAPIKGGPADRAGVLPGDEVRCGGSAPRRWGEKHDGFLLMVVIPHLTVDAHCGEKCN
jgi:hypothetical protein